MLKFYYFLARWAPFSFTRIWQWKICDKHYMYYNKRITTCVKHLSSLKLNTSCASESRRCYQSTSSSTNSKIYQMPRVSFLEKVDGTRSKFQGFVNQIWHIFWLQSWQYSTRAFQVGFIGILLFGAALSWFAPLLEKNSHLFEDLDDFFTQFNDIFGKIDRVWMATTKLHSLCQGSRLASVYAVDFHQLGTVTVKEAIVTKEWLFFGVFSQKNLYVI